MIRNKKEPKQLLPKLKKELKNFCFSEEGKISKKSIAKIGFTLALLGNIFESAEAHHGSHSQTTNQNYFFPTSRGGHASGAVVTHASHPSHTSHGSHGSHGQW